MWRTVSLSALSAVLLVSSPAAAEGGLEVERAHRCYVPAEEVVRGRALLAASLPDPPAPERRFAEADPDVSTTGELIVADLDVCASGQDPSTCGYTVEGSLRGRNVYDFAYYASHFIKRISGAMADRIEIPIIFSDFQTIEYPGAYYMDVRNDVSGIGVPVVDHNPLYGRPRGSALSGIISMNLWWNCALNAQNRFQDDCRDEPPFGTTYQSLHNILAHEVGHRWGVGLLFRDPIRGTASDETLGRAGNHWSYWMNSRSPLEGNHWVDEGGGQFRTERAPFVRFSDFDLYAMGLMAKEEVAPTFLIRPEGCPGQAHCTGEQQPVIEGTRSARGTRVDIGIDDVIAALGPRAPSVQEQPKIIRTAFVMARQKAGSAADSFGADDETFRKLERVRRYFNEHYYEATGTRARITTTLSGRDDYPRWEFTISPEGWGSDGATGQPASIGGMVGVQSASGGEVALVHDDVQLRASEYKSATIRVSAPKSAGGSKLRLSFGGIGGALGKPLDVKVKADGKVHEYSFDLRKSESWKGEVGRIRIALAGAPAGTHLAVDRFEIGGAAAGGGSESSGEKGGCGAAMGDPSLLVLLLAAGAVLARRRLATTGSTMEAERSRSSLPRSTTSPNWISTPWA